MKNRKSILLNIKKFLNEFENETDRAAVILGVAKLDTLLYQLLGKFFLPSPTGSDDLLDGDSPLSTFSAKIHVAYRLGLIDAPFAKFLHLVRKIRNAFAHELSGSTLDSGAHRDRVKELVLPFKGLPFFQFFENAFFSGRNRLGPSAEFRTVISIMVSRLEHFILLEAGTINADRALTLIRKDWIEEKWKKELSDTPQNNEGSKA